MHCLLYDPRSRKREKALLEDKALASGGEGSIHRVLYPDHLKRHCVKLFISERIIQRKKEKVFYMAQYPPLRTQDPNFLFCWPKMVVIKKKQIVGFLMPLAFEDSQHLEYLFLPKIEDPRYLEWQKKFNRNTEEGVKARIGLCANIAFAIHNFHSIGQYSMVDLNPNNILVTIKGKVSLIDCDSVQVKAPNGRIYHGEMAMPDYIPPESVYTRSSKNYIDHNWHRFSLAVIFYKILYGIHPYAATSSGVYAGATSLGEKIQNGLFVHGKKRKYLTSIPGPHDDFFLLPSSIRRLFIRAFETNNSILGNRPSADDWGAVLKRELDHNFQLLGESFYSRPRKVMKVERPTRSFTIDWEVTTKQSGQNTSYLFWKELFRQAAFGRALYYVDIRGQQKYKFIFLLLIWAWTVPILFWVFEAIHFFKTEYLTIGCAFLFASVYFIIAYFISLVSAVFFHFSKNHPRVKMIW